MDDLRIEAGSLCLPHHGYLDNAIFEAVVRNGVLCLFLLSVAVRLVLLSLGDLYNIRVSHC